MMSGKRAQELLDDLPPISYVWQTPVRRPRVSEADVPDPVAPQRVTPAMRARLRSSLACGASAPAVSPAAG